MIMAGMSGALLAVALVAGCAKGDSARSEQVAAVESRPTQQAPAVAMSEVTLEVLGMT